MRDTKTHRLAIDCKLTRYPIIFAAETVRLHSAKRLLRRALHCPTSTCVVAAFPCVLPTTIECDARRIASSNSRGIEREEIVRSRTPSSSGFPRAMTLATTTRLDAGCKCAATKGVKNEIPRLSSIVE